MSTIDSSEKPHVSYKWSIVMDGGQVVTFEGGNTAGAAQFVEEVKHFHLTGEKPDGTRNFRFPTHNHGTILSADILVDISKVQLVLREPIV